jgi:hypothetical protein
MIVFVDQGNSFTKFHLKTRTFYNKPSFITYISEFTPDELTFYLLASNSVWNKQLQSALGDDLKVSKVKLTFKSALNLIPDDLQGSYPSLGEDRLIKTYAAAKFCRLPACALFDFGTALTLNLYAQAGFLGGYITLGFKTSLEATFQSVPSLKKFEADVKRLYKSDLKTFTKSSEELPKGNSIKSASEHNTSFYSGADIESNFNQGKQYTAINAASSSTSTHKPTLDFPESSAAIYQGLKQKFVGAIKQYQQDTYYKLAPYFKENDLLKSNNLADKNANLIKQNYDFVKLGNSTHFKQASTAKDKDFRISMLACGGEAQLFSRYFDLVLSDRELYFSLIDSSL